MGRGPRVVISGIGLVTGLGPDAASTWSAVREGRCGLHLVDVPGVGPVIACPSPLEGTSDLDPTMSIQPRAEDEAHLRKARAALWEWESRLAAGRALARQ